VEKRVKGVKITPYCGKIQDKDEDYYKQFAMIICGLDSIEARRWINATLVDMVDEEDPDSLKPLIDGGTEGESCLVFVTFAATKREFRLQGSGKGDISNHDLLHRVPARYACAACCSATVHLGYHPTSTTALH
jgi:molybdopterin/thiamine biosynthesis adenylyltransferase